MTKERPEPTSMTGGDDEFDLLIDIVLAIAVGIVCIIVVICLVLLPLPM